MRGAGVTLAEIVVVAVVVGGLLACACGLVPREAMEALAVRHHPNGGPRYDVVALGWIGALVGLGIVAARGGWL